MPSKTQSHSKAMNGSAKPAASAASSKSSASPAPAAAAPPITPPPPPFNAIPHATCGNRLIGVEVGSAIPALMSELGELLQQTPGSGAGGSGGSGGSGAGLWRGQNGGLLFEHLEGAAASPGETAAAALFGGIDATRRMDQISPQTLERLSQMLQQQRQSCYASTATVVGLKRTVEVLDDEEDADADSASGSSGAATIGSTSATGTTVNTTTGATAGATADASSRSRSATSASNRGDYDSSGSAAGSRRSNLDEVFEMMQRGLGARDKPASGNGNGNGSGGGGDLGFDSADYADPLTQLELFRAMMVATSKGRTGGAGAASPMGQDGGKADDVYEARGRSAATAAGLRAGAVAAGCAINGDVGLSSQLRSFLDAFSPQLLTQLMSHPRPAKAAAAAAAAAAGAGSGGGGGAAGVVAGSGAAGGKSGDAAAAAAAAAVAREVDVATSGVANLADLQQRVEQVRGLCSSTLEALAEDEVSDSTSCSLRDLLLGDGGGAVAGGGTAAAAASAELELSSAKVGYCLTEAAAVAVSMLWNYLGSQQKEAPLLLGYTREEAQSQFNLLLFRLRQELSAQPASSLAEVSQCFGGTVQPDAEDIYRAINGVGVLLFFTCKPLPLLEKACSELRISLSDSANTDCNVMPELIAEKLAAFLYPMKEGKLSFAHLSFIPRVQVHEHAPGNYTCTVDNASNMGRMLRERLLSNRFSCNKIKWRAALVNEKGELTFQVWHRHTTVLSVHILVRTSEPKKKKKGGAAGGAGADDKEVAGSAVDDLRANSALFMERQVTAAPGEMVGFTQDFLELVVALNSPTTLQHGYRTYNKVDDRLVFQFSLQLSNVDGSSLDGPSAVSVTATPPVAAAMQAGSLPAAGKQAVGKQSPCAAEEPEPSVSGSTAGKTDGGDSKDDADAELHAAMRRVTDAERVARGVMEETAKWDYRHLQNDACREAHRARLRAEERERKATLAKVGPTPDLIKEVEKLTQSVQATQQQIANLVKEKARDDKESEKTAEKVSQSKAELESLKAMLTSGAAELAKWEADAKAAEARIAEKRTRLARKEAKKAEQNQWTALKRVLEPTSSTTHHDTLAINDLGSFLQCTATLSSGIGADEALQHHEQHQPPQQQSPRGLSAGPSSSSLFGTNTAGPGIPPLAGGGGGGLSAFGTDPFSSSRAPMGASPSNTLASATPVFSTQPKPGLGHSGSNSGSAGLGLNGGSTSPGAAGHSHVNGMMGSSVHGTTSSHPGSVSPMVPPSPGVMSNTSAAMGSRSSPASAVGVSVGSPGMPLTSGMGNGVPGGSGVGMGGGISGLGSSGAGGGGTVIGGGGGLSFGLAPSLFSTNPVSHAAMSAAAAAAAANGGMSVGHNTANNLYTSLDANAQPFSPSPPPAMPAKPMAGPGGNGAAAMGNGPAGAAAMSSSGGGGEAGPVSGGGGGGARNGGGGNFAFTVTAGAPSGLMGGNASPLYQVAPSAFSTTSAHDLTGHSPSPFSTTPRSTPAANGMFGMGGGAGGVGAGHGNAADIQQAHSGMFPPRPHTPNELLSFSTSLQWRN